MLIPTWFLLLAWVIGRRLHRHRLADQRSRLAGADRRPRADRHADRLHHHAERLRRRRPDAWRGLRRRAQGAGADRQRRHHLRLGRRRRPRLCQSRGRGAARPDARRARRAGLELARRAAPVPSATATAPASTPCWSRGAGASTRISGCARPTASISGSACKARPVVGPDGEVVRIVGTLGDVTEIKTSEERLLHDAVHDNLTGLPNRELFFDRLGAGAGDGADRPEHPPDRDQHRHRPLQADQRAVGVSAGDSILLTLARRLGRILKPQDTLARLSGDQFAALIVSETRDRTDHRARQYGAARRLDAGDLQRQGNSPSPPRSASRSTTRNCIASARTC